MTDSLNIIELTFVKPFYLKMMGLHALGLTSDLQARLVDAGRTVTTADIRWMLRAGAWRPVAMGAWFSLAGAAEPIVDDLIAAMSHSQGSLTAPPLAAAATLLAGDAAMPAMTDYINFITDLARRDGSESFMAAAIDHLGTKPDITVPDADHRRFHDLHDVAVYLRQTWLHHGHPDAYNPGHSGLQRRCGVAVQEQASWRVAASTARWGFACVDLGHRITT